MVSYKVNVNFYLKIYLKMTTLQQLLNKREYFDYYIQKLHIDPKIFQSDEDKFVFLAKKAVENDELNEEEIHIVQSPFFEESIHKAKSLYEVGLYIINKSNHNNHKDDLFNHKTDSCMYADLDEFMKGNDVVREFNDNEQYSYCYFQPHKNLVEVDIAEEEDAENAYKISFKRPSFFDEIQFTNDPKYEEFMDSQYHTLMHMYTWKSADRFTYFYNLHVTTHNKYIHSITFPVMWNSTRKHTLNFKEAVNEYRAILAVEHYLEKTDIQTSDFSLMNSNDHYDDLQHIQNMTVHHSQKSDLLNHINSMFLKDLDGQGNVLMILFDGDILSGNIKKFFSAVHEKDFHRQLYADLDEVLEGVADFKMFSENNQYLYCYFIPGECLLEVHDYSEDIEDKISHRHSVCFKKPSNFTELLEDTYNEFMISQYDLLMDVYNLLDH